MLIKALCDYYDLLEDDERTPEYLSEQEVSYMIMLSEDGIIKSISDVTIEKKEQNKKGKEKTTYEPRKILLPKRTQKSTIDLNIIEHRPLYIFGLNYDKGTLTTEDRTNKAKKSHEIFKNGNLEFFKDLSSPISKAFYNFLESWQPENETENPLLLNLGQDISSNKYFCFALDGHPEITLHEEKEVIEKFRRLFEEKNLADSELMAVDSISGEVQPIADIHEKIKGVAGGQSSGNVLVSFKEPAFESYGKEKSFNSSVSINSMKKYTYSLNKLLSDQTHKIIVDETTVVFFAISKKDELECEWMQGLCCSKPSKKEVEQQVNSILNDAKKGIESDYSAFDIDENDSFYIVGLTPNGSRLSQKFIVKNKFGNIIDSIAAHQRDMALEADGRSVYIGEIVKELVSPKSKNEKVPPPLISDLFNAVLTGANYPQSLLSTVIRRIKTDSDDPENKEYYIKLNDTRVGIIKACLNRKARLSNKEEEIKMGLDLSNTNQAYLCGRLFAVLEKIQKEASDDKLNRTIKDSYFSTAASKPATVFPKLFMLAQNHLSKLEYAVTYNNQIGEIVNMLEDEFPTTLSLDDQGRFIIGYYQQNKALYTRKETE